MAVEKINPFKPYALDAKNAGSFAFLLDPDTIRRLESGDGTAGFLVQHDWAHVGALCGRFISPGEYEISWLYVLPRYRKQGAGAFMLQTLYELLNEEDVEISLSFLRTDQDTVGLCEFLEKMGFSEYAMAGQEVFSARLGEIYRTKHPKVKLDYPIAAFETLPDVVFKDFSAKHGDEFVPMPEGGFFDASIDKKLSLGVLSKDKKTLLGFVILERSGEDALLFSSLYMDKGLDQTALSGLISELMERAKDLCDMSTLLYIPVVNEEVGALLEKLFPRKVFEEISVSYRRKLYAASFDYENGSLTDFLIQNIDDEVVEDPTEYMDSVFES